jgi:CHAT domain-containing protein/Flp pilus assembly protein TadD
MALQKTDTTTHKALLVLLQSWVTLCQGSLALFIGTLFFSESVAATPQLLTPQQKSQEVVGEKHSSDRLQHFTQNSISECYTLVCDGLISEVEGEAFTQQYLGVTDNIKREGFTPTKDKQLFPFSLSLFPSDEATRAAADQAFEEGQQLRKQGTAESLRQAITKYEQALPLYRAVGDRQSEAITLNNIGYIYDALGEKPKALEYYNQALPIFRATGDKAGEAMTLNNMGVVYDALGEKPKALEYLNQSLPLRRVTGDKAGEVDTLNNIGGVYLDLGEKPKALDFYNQSLPLVRAVGDKAKEATTLNNIGTVYDALGEKQKALEFYNQSLPLARTTGDKAQEAVTLNNIGRVYDALGEKQKALNFYNQSLPLRRATGDKVGEAVNLNNIGAIYYALGEKQKALDFYNQSLLLKRATGDKAGEARTLNNIGKVYSDLGEKRKALELYNQSLSLTRTTGDKAREAVTLSNIGAVYYELGEKQKALELYNQSLPLSRATGDKAQEAVTLYNLAYLQRSQGNLNSALTQIEAAITIIEDLRTKIDSQELRASYFATVQNYYKFYIDLLMQLHKTNPNKGYDALALNVSERSRARSLIELLTEAQANIRQGADPKLLEQETTLQQQLDTLEKRRLELVSGKYTDAQLQALEQERQTLQQEYQQLQDQIRQTSPRYASLKYPEPLTLSEIQQQVLDDDTLLLEYSLGEERSYLWAVTKTSFTSYELPKRADIETLAQSFYQNTGKQKAPQRGIGVTPREDSQEITTKLSQILLSPVAEQLAGKRLLIVGDGALQYLPFAALPTPDSLGKDKTPVPLIVNHEIVNSPSASTVAIIRQDTNGRKLAPKKVAVIADPVFSKDDERVKTLVGQASRLSEDSSVLEGEGGKISRGEGGQDAHPTSQDSELSVLALTRSAREAGISFQRLPFTRTEGDRILSLIPNTQSQSAFDFAANRATATSPQLSQYQIVHFATHGILNSQNPELSGVVLSLVDETGTSQNGFLRLNDIFNLNLPAELVVLSACETGLGKEIKGEGLVGLTRGFMYAGSPRVLVSLWSVADEGTSELMTRFYKKMLQENLQPVAALRAAQLEMLQTPQWKSPYYWAAFTLQGEWK